MNEVITDLYNSGVIPCALAAMRVRNPDDDLISYLQFKLLSVPSKFDASRGLLRDFAIMYLCSRIKDWRRAERKRRAKFTDAPIPQVQAPANAYACLEGAVAEFVKAGEQLPAGNFSRKKFEIRKARIQRMQREVLDSQAPQADDR